MPALSASVEDSQLSGLTDTDIFRCRIFLEPLVPIGNKTTQIENAALMDALKQYSKRVDQDDDSGINNFIKQYPNSPWCSALLLNLGLEYRQTGWFLKALAAWERAWELSKCATEPKAKALADRIIGELAEFNARLGRYARVEAILKEIKDRPLRGSATEKVTGARESNWLMREQPGRAFTCGPAALNRLHALENPNEPSNRRILDARSTERGMTLTQVMQLARKSKMDYVGGQAATGSKGHRAIASELEG